ncbi:DUF2780 domain-containing protein [Povalibacter sp.]|uniref:DUF2780 domain-containing protein n=1 Tax=Povalibacter sp. TaxID=1962978 RepID=UPI002F3E6E02
MSGIPRRLVMLGLAALPLAASAQIPDVGSLTSAMKSPLLGMLTSQLGVTEQQATGGIGSYLTLAQEKLAKGDFDRIAGLVPGASKYMEQAKALGAVTGPLKNLAGLNGALGNLGMQPETVAKFAPTVTDYLGKAGGSGVQSMLAGILK